MKQKYLKCAGAALLPLIVLSAFLFHSKEEPPDQEPQYISAVKLLREHRRQLSEWQKLIMAIAWTESKFNPDAIGKAKDYGVMQITPIYVKEVNRISGANFDHADAFSTRKTLEMFDAIQCAKNPQKDLDKAIWLHNKSAAYRQEVLRNLEFIERYEQFRSEVVQYD